MLWQKLEAAGDLAGMEQFVARFSDGPYVGLARRAIETLRTGDTQVAAATVVPEPAAEPMADDTPLRQVTPQPVAQADPRETEPQLLQYALSALGFYDGTVDGQFGPASRRAVARYQESIGTPATGELTEVEAVSLVAAAAEAGDANSQVAYGLLFARGAGVEQDYVRAAQWFDRAADSGNGFGQMNLALLYSNGLGVAVDKVRARALLSQAELNGVPEAGALLQTMGD
jgi:TPR repeat protein